MMGHKTEWPDDKRRLGRWQSRHGQLAWTSCSPRRTGASGSRRGPGLLLARSKWAGRNDSARSASGSRCRITVAGSGGGVSPDSFVPHRPAVDSLRSGYQIGSRERTIPPVVPAAARRVRSLGQPPVGVHEPNNRVTRSVDLASITDRVRSPGAVRPAELIRPASGARHGRGAFTTDLRGGLSQWYGGRLGSFVSWYGPRTASAVVCLFVAIAPPLNNLMSAVCSRRVPAPASLSRLTLILTPRLFELTFQPVIGSMILRSPGPQWSRSTRCI